MHWSIAPQTGKRPPRIRHMDLVAVGRSLHVLGGRLDEDPTAAFRGPPCEYDSAYDFLYAFDTDRCEWKESCCNGQIPFYPSRATLCATESDIWAIVPSVTEKTWWKAGAPTRPADHPEDKGVKSTKF